MITTSVLMCHAPIVVPGISSPERARPSAASTAAMAAAGRHVCATDPDAVVIVSPHAPRARDAFIVASEVRAEGDFARFGSPDIGVSLPGAGRRGEAILAAAREARLPTVGHELGPLDHGTLVPLWFLVESGWTGPTIRIALPMSPSHDACEALGAVLRAAADAEGERWAFVASGDMSHRLLPDAPAGYDPRAQDFDDEVRAAVDAGRLHDLRSIDPALRERAAEDVVDSLDVAHGVTAGISDGHRTLSYEGPYGVGYLIAILRA